MAVEWKYYRKFEAVNGKYLPDRGEGDTMASQIVTAVNKLIYKWYNDGDVYDNTRYLTGWANDISSFANWLHKYTSAVGILEGVWNCWSDDEYENLLKRLADQLMDEEDLEHMSEIPKAGSVYECDGPFLFEEAPDDECEYEEEEIW